MQVDAEPVAFALAGEDVVPGQGKLGVELVKEGACAVVLTELMVCPCLPIEGFSAHDGI